MDDATDFCCQQIDGNLVFTAFGNNDIGISFGRLDKGFVHDPHSLHILTDDAFKRTSSFLHVTQQSADEADICIRINEHLDIEHLSEFLIFQNEQTFEDQYVARIACLSRSRSCMIDKIICRLLNRSALDQISDMADQKIVVSRSKKTFKANKLAKKAASFITTITKAHGKLTYKTSSKKITFKKTAVGTYKVTAKKGTKAGTYTITVRFKATKNYKAAERKITVTVK